MKVSFLRVTARLISLTARFPTSSPIATYQLRTPGLFRQPGQSANQPLLQRKPVGQLYSSRRQISFLQVLKRFAAKCITIGPLAGWYIEGGIPIESSYNIVGRVYGPFQLFYPSEYCLSPSRAPTPVVWGEIPSSVLYLVMKHSATRRT